MTRSPLRIATRQSPLALWQAEHVRARLQALDPDCPVELVPMVTDGDRWLQAPLSTLGGKDLFVKELERALLDGRADIAVHSMKDVGATLPDGLTLRCVLEREDPHDALVGPASSPAVTGLDAVARGARMGTCSLRRRSQLLGHRADLHVGMLRGNVNSRLAKLDAGEHDVIVLAAAGLMRLGLEHRIGHRLPVDTCLPAIGQGIIGIECRRDDAATHALIDRLHHVPTAVRLAAERTVSRRLDAGCSAPLAGHATLEGSTLTLTALAASLDGTTRLECRRVIELPAGDDEAAMRAAVELGDAVTDRLLDEGAQRVLDEAAAQVRREAERAGQADEAARADQGAQAPPARTGTPADAPSGA